MILLRRTTLRVLLLPVGSRRSETLLTLSLLVVCQPLAEESSYFDQSIMSNKLEAHLSLPEQALFRADSKKIQPFHTSIRHCFPQSLHETVIRALNNVALNKESSSDISTAVKNVR